MEVSNINDQLCIELDTGSIFSDYEDYIPSFNDSSATISYDITSVLHNSQSRSASGVTNAYREGDSIMASRSNSVIRFPLP